MTQTHQGSRGRRVERFIALGFSEADANLLADVRDPHRDKNGRVWQHSLYHGRVRALLADGWTHKQIMVVFS